MSSPIEIVSAVFSQYFDWIMFAAMGLVALWSVSRRNGKQRHARQLLRKAIHEDATAISLHPEVDPRRCTGCGTCTAACPEGEVLQLVKHRSVLVAPAKCVGHGECERACPMGAITLVFGTKTRGIDIPRITSDFETNVPGVYIAGELGGMGLIRNAVKQGHLAAKHALENLRTIGGHTDTDILIVGAGPAGMSASLTAVAAKKRYLCIEQNSFGGTVANFPRQKIVMTSPVVLPIVGPLKFKSNKVPKEELLEKWERIRKATTLKIQEAITFRGFEVHNGIFVVATSAGLIRTRKVILAMGVRGTPRKLGLPNEDLPKVTYHLVDPQQYRNRSIAIVGSGNSAAEAAIALANPRYENKVTLLVRGQGLSRCNDENERNVSALIAEDRIQMLTASEVKEIDRDFLVVQQKEQTVQLPNDYLLILAGTELPHKFLMGLGIEIEKKFGEPLATKLPDRKAL
ncbi:MAG: NAD(P)-binding domain-containing protein [Deltaproteobacteria bacterium]|nr:NAD(P)-binding domain-containing protein [Deltaproteobacteria bacterium]